MYSERDAKKLHIVGCSIFNHLFALKG